MEETIDDPIRDSIAYTVDELVTRMYYAAGYAGKKQPQGANLLHTLHDSLMRFDHYSSELQATGQSTEKVDCAKRLLQSLVSATNRRMHTGFPSVYAFLLGKPNHYSSHEFVSWSIHELMSIFHALAIKNWTTDALKHQDKDARGVPYPSFEEPFVSCWTISGSTSTHFDKDYSYRPEIMERFPFYFFLAGTKKVKTLKSQIWAWFAASESNNGTLRKCQASSGDPVVRGDHPCYRNGEDPALYVRSKLIKEGTRFIPLRDQNGQIVLRADHYREICLREPWKVPLLFGNLPAPPKDSSDEIAKGKYALFAMMLLRPWRDLFLAIQSWIGPPRPHQTSSPKAIWMAVYDAYVVWRNQLEKSVAPYFSREKNSWLPAPRYDAPEWWDCRVHQIVENMDMALAHPGHRISKVPNSSTLALENDHETPNTGD